MLSYHQEDLGHRHSREVTELEATARRLREEEERRKIEEEERKRKEQIEADKLMAGLRSKKEYKSLKNIHHTFSACFASIKSFCARISSL